MEGGSFLSRRRRSPLSSPFLFLTFSTAPTSSGAALRRVATKSMVRAASAPTQGASADPRAAARTARYLPGTSEERGRKTAAGAPDGREARRVGRAAAGGAGGGSSTWL